MAYLEEIPEYKSDILLTFAKNKNIMTYIGNEKITDASDLLGENIFPNPYVPNTESEVKVYVCLDIYVPRIKDKIFKDVQIVINIFSHKDKKRYKGNPTRPPSTPRATVPGVASPPHRQNRSTPGICPLVSAQKADQTAGSG